MSCYYSLEEKIYNLAFLSRISVLVIQLVSNWIIPDHEADAFMSPPDPDLLHSLGDSVVDNVFGGLVRWDAHYFIHIAEYGYTHENTLAFFPLFPMLIRLCAKVLYIVLHLFFNYHSTIVLTAVFLNFFIFIKTSTIFYRLSREVLHNDILAYRAAILFCINPASIFFSAPYSEAVFAFCTFSALLNYEQGGGWSAPTQFGLAGAARSNGLVNMGFVLYHKLRHCSTYYYNLRRARSDSSLPLSHVLVVLLTFNYTLGPLFVASCAVLAPFVIFQAWCYMVYCGDEAGSSLPPHLESFVRSNFLHSPDLGEAEWCYAAMPLAYTHVQDKYWEVGLLKYYALRQLPNFLLAVPVVLMIICHAALYFVDNPQVVWSLGIPHPDHIDVKLTAIHAKNDDDEERDKKCTNPKDLKTVPSTSGRDVKKNNKDRAGVSAGRFRWCNSGLGSWRVFVYTVHGLAVCFFCLLFINAQVTTRLVCSSCPVVYWFAAHLLTSDCSASTGFDKSAASSNKGGVLSKTGSPNSKVLVKPLRPEPLENMDKMFKVELLWSLPSNFWGQAVVSYFVVYYLLGTVMFANFLPWT